MGDYEPCPENKEYNCPNSQGDNCKYDYISKKCLKRRIEVASEISKALGRQKDEYETRYMSPEDLLTVIDV